uniref:Uncharacterized protein n=1 Tax=Chelonoidis abingdonii TaxID=106734 RepID=A0A8C0GPM3_CHEAB
MKLVFSPLSGMLAPLPDTLMFCLDRPSSGRLPSPYFISLIGHCFLFLHLYNFMTMWGGHCHSSPGRLGEGRLCRATPMNGM